MYWEDRESGDKRGDRAPINYSSVWLYLIQFSAKEVSPVLRMMQEIVGKKQSELKYMLSLSLPLSPSLLSLPLPSPSLPPLSSLPPSPSSLSPFPLSLLLLFNVCLNLLDLHRHSTDLTSLYHQMLHIADRLEAKQKTDLIVKINRK
jgi:hypothetical protein